jgi:hypothetical protein
MYWSLFSILYGIFYYLLIPFLNKFYFKIEGIVYLAGQIGLDSPTMLILFNSVDFQTQQTIKHIEAVLLASNSNIQNTILCNIYLTDMRYKSFLYFIHFNFNIKLVIKLSQKNIGIIYFQRYLFSFI